MLCSTVSANGLHVFQVTAAGELVHGHHSAGTGDFPTETVTRDCDPHVAPTSEVFNNNLQVFAQKTGGQIVWGVLPHGGSWEVKVLGG